MHELSPSSSRCGYKTARDAVQPRAGRLRSSPSQIPQKGQPPSRRLTGIWRKRVSRARLTGVIVLAAAASLVMGACAAKNNTSSPGAPSTGVDLPVVSQVPVAADAVLPAGDGKATCSGVTIAYAGAETGSNAQLGLNIVNGVQLALNQHNTANPNCQVTLK